MKKTKIYKDTDLCVYTFHNVYFVFYYIKIVIYSQLLQTGQSHTGSWVQWSSVLACPSRMLLEKVKLDDWLLEQSGSVYSELFSAVKFGLECISF